MLSTTARTWRETSPPYHSQAGGLCAGRTTEVPAEGKGLCLLICTLLNAHISYYVQKFGTVFVKKSQTHQDCIYKKEIKRVKP